MKFLKLMFGFVLATMLNTAFALSVPFEQIPLAPGATLVADYNFKGEFGDHAMIFCFEGSQQNVGLIRWPLNGQPQFSTLPVLLKIDPQFEGQFADRVGLIFITNTVNTVFFVSCVFGF